MANDERGGWKALVTVLYALAVVFVAAASFLLGSVSGEQDGRQIEAGTLHQSNAKNEISQTCIGLDPARMFECVYNGVEAAKESEYAEQDLKAQQGMHAWAIAMATATILQVFVSGIALYFLMQDLRQNRSSAEHQLRANLAVRPAGIASLIAAPYVLGRVLLTNVGSTLAKNVSLEVNAEMCVGKSKTDFPVDPDPGQVPRALHSGDEMSQGSANSLLLGDIKSPANYIFVWGIAYYDDGFGQRRFTRFCHRYACASHDRQTISKATAKGVRESLTIIDRSKARLHETGNDAD